jgi:hypothetical protein
MRFNQNQFLAAVALKLSKENSNSKRRVDKKEPIAPWVAPYAIMGARSKSISPERR